MAREENCAAVFASGISQTGRVLREFVFQGLNAGEGGAPVFDGIHADIASARRGEFNRRYAQPGLLSPMMPEYGPPYDSAALLARQRKLGGVPKLLLTNSAWEYWRGDGARSCAPCSRSSSSGPWTGSRHRRARCRGRLTGPRRAGRRCSSRYGNGSRGRCS